MTSNRMHTQRHLSHGIQLKVDSKEITALLEYRAMFQQLLSDKDRRSKELYAHLHRIKFHLGDPFVIKAEREPIEAPERRDIESLPAIKVESEFIEESADSDNRQVIKTELVEDEQEEEARPPPINRNMLYAEAFSLKCDECDRHCDEPFDLHIDFINHMDQFHGDTKPYKCHQCDTGYTTRSSLMHHLERVHDKKVNYECDVCHKGFYYKGNWRNHCRIHSGERPFACDRCRKSFTRKAGLISHQRTHTGEKPFTCGQCSKTFTRRDNLMTHIRTHTGEKPYECAKCHKRFRQSHHKKRHQKKCKQ